MYLVDDVTNFLFIYSDSVYFTHVDELFGKKDVTLQRESDNPVCGGACQFWQAEITPIEPEPDNAGGGRELQVNACMSDLLTRVNFIQSPLLSKIQN